MTIPAGRGDGKAKQRSDTGGIVVVWPDVRGLPNAEAAEVYAKAGVPIVPVRPGTKNPGSYLGNGWPQQATTDLDTVRAWWRRWPDAGIAMHVGGAQLLVIDVDNPDNVPAWLWPLLERAVFRRTTTDPANKRGHYIYRLQPGERFGGGLGKLKPPKGKGWGEVRCYGGAIVLAPSIHPRASEGGAYSGGPDEPIPYVPDEITAKLNAAADPYIHEPLTLAESDAQAAAFLDAYAADAEPYALRPIVAAFDPTPGGRHDSMWSAVCWALREAKAGRFPAQRAVDELRGRWSAAFDGPGRVADSDEFNRMVRDAVAIADASDAAALQERAGGFACAENFKLAQRALAPGGRWHPDTLWPAAENRASEGDRPSWAPVNVGAARRGIGAAPPTILMRSDGACLFYAGKTHSVHGESESGKSWLVQCAAAESLLAGDAVLYLDFEDEAGPVGDRLILLGVPAEVVDDATKFVYVHPDQSPTTDAERAAFDALLERSYALAVIDGVTDSMGVFGLSTKDNDDVARWQRTLPKAIARLTGAAVVCVDHVTKDSDSRGRFALGGQHKMAGLSGAAYLVEMERPFAVGQAGRASVRVGKDRPGLIRGLGGRWRKSDRTQHVADLYLDSTDTGRAIWSLDAPGDAGHATDVEEGKPGGKKRADFRPTWFMEQISRYWEETDEPDERTSNKTVNAMCRERKEQGKTQHRDLWRTAIKALVDEGFAKTETGARDSEIHVVVKQYRQIEDPLCDRYSDAAANGVTTWKHKLSDHAEGDET